MEDSFDLGLLRALLGTVGWTGRDASIDVVQRMVVFGDSKRSDLHASSVGVGEKKTETSSFNGEILHILLDTVEIVQRSKDSKTTSKKICFVRGGCVENTSRRQESKKGGLAQSVQGREKDSWVVCSGGLVRRG